MGLNGLGPFTAQSGLKLPSHPPLCSPWSPSSSSSRRFELFDRAVGSIGTRGGTPSHVPAKLVLEELTRLSLRSPSASSRRSSKFPEALH
ncbi:hypothetical protein NL676_011310 [Syzygium grande]|nr:hypothetical protein NL676_011310 [Syzygium grande]